MMPYSGSGIQAAGRFKETFTCHIQSFTSALADKVIYTDRKVQPNCPAALFVLGSSPVPRLLSLIFSFYHEYNSRPRTGK